MNKELLKKYDNDFYKIMSENFGEEIFVTDGEGVVLYLNQISQKDIQSSAAEVVGRNVAELVAEGKFSPSVSLEVIKQRKTVSLIQTIPGNIKVLVTGVPVFNAAKDKIELIISTTKKIDEIAEMIETMEAQKREISGLKNMAFQEAGFIVGGDDTDYIIEKIPKIAPLDVPILITGETGVGKGVAAKTIHKFKFPEGEKPFIKINCSTIPETLIESELFGYEKGAFTGASDHGKQGKIEMSNGGTLFLDEIGELPLTVQVKLLDFIQDGEFTRIGGTSPIKVTTRLITATNRNLKKMCQEETFRTELYFRINVVNLEIPPLRERHSDLEALTKHFLSNCNSKYRNTKRIDAKAMEILKEYDWPGNIRELEHVVENLHIFAEGYNIGEEDVRVALYGSENQSGEKGNEPAVICKGIMPLKEAKHMVEKQLVMEAYKQSGSTYKAAEILGVDQSTVSKIMKKFTEK